MNHIENLLDRYFEGNTSAEEEAEIRRFFTTGDIPEHLATYTPLFAYFEDEIKKAQIGKIVPLYKHRNRLKWWLSGAVACAALLTGIFFTTPRQVKCLKEGNYIIIDGRCYTDMKMIRSTALKTLREVSNDDSEFSDGNTLETNKIVESQLREFDFLFSE